MEGALGWGWDHVDEALGLDESYKRFMRGKVVQFTATVQASNDDPHFGFYKRPSKASLLASGRED